MEQTLVKKESVECKSFSIKKIQNIMNIKKLIFVKRSEDICHFLSLNGQRQVFQWEDFSISKMLYQAKEETLDLHKKKNIILLSLVSIKFVLFNAITFDCIYTVDFTKTSLNVSWIRINC